MPFTRTPTPRELRQDVLLAAVLLVGGILSAGLSSIAKIYGDQQAPLWTAIPYLLLVAGTLAVRRRWPAVVAVVISLSYVAAVTIRIPEVYVGNIAMFIALYTVGAWMTSRRMAFLVRIGVMFVMAVWLIIVMYRDAIEQAAKADVAAGAFSPYVAYMMLNVMLNVLYFGGAYYFGERSWNAAAQHAALEQRTRELERERALSAAQAVALDRVRIARELHDVVAHHVSVMGVQAGAARLTIRQDPQAATEIVAGIETSARAAIRDFHQLLDTLRTPNHDADGHDAASTVGIDDIPELVSASTASGLPARLQIVGAPVSVPRITAVNLYRIAQESLTNARRHGGPGVEADVRIRYGQGSVELEVVNSGRFVPAVRSGLGLLGMRERAAASGGTIELLPRPTGGFRVRVTVPVPVDGIAALPVPVPVPVPVDRIAALPVTVPVDGIAALPVPLDDIATLPVPVDDIATLPVPVDGLAAFPAPVPGSAGGAAFSEPAPGSGGDAVATAEPSGRAVRSEPTLPAADLTSRSRA